MCEIQCKNRKRRSIEKERNYDCTDEMNNVVFGSVAGNSGSVDDNSRSIAGITWVFIIQFI